MEDAAPKAPAPTATDSQAPAAPAEPAVEPAVAPATEPSAESDADKQQEDKKPEPSPAFRSIFPASGNDDNLDIPDLSFPSFE